MDDLGEDRNKKVKVASTLPQRRNGSAISIHCTAYSHQRPVFIKVALGIPAVRINDVLR